MGSTAGGADDGTTHSIAGLYLPVRPWEYPDADLLQHNSDSPRGYHGNSLREVSIGTEKNDLLYRSLWSCLWHRIGVVNCPSQSSIRIWPLRLQNIMGQLSRTNHSCQGYVNRTNKRRAGCLAQILLCFIAFRAPSLSSLIHSPRQKSLSPEVYPATAGFPRLLYTFLWRIYHKSDLINLEELPSRSIRYRYSISAILALISSRVIRFHFF